MMPDSASILLFIGQILIEPVQLVGAFIAAFAAALYFVHKFVELLNPFSAK